MQEPANLYWNPPVFFAFLCVLCAFALRLNREWWRQPADGRIVAHHPSLIAHHFPLQHRHRPFSRAAMPLSEAPSRLRHRVATCGIAKQ